jgi:predicted ABC-type ATPase
MEPVPPRRMTPFDPAGKPVLIAVAGPNGSGKSTFHEHYLAPLGLPFVNADLIARGMAAEGIPVTDYGAAKAAERRRLDLLASRQPFCMETVFSDKGGSKLTFFRKARKNGYSVVLIFIGLAHVDLSRMRVAQRVAAGGHDVPGAKIEARFPRTLENLANAIRFVDRVFLLDNSSFDEPYRPVAVCVSGETHQLYPPLPAWAFEVLPRPLVQRSK